MYLTINIKLCSLLLSNMKSGIHNKKDLTKDLLYNFTIKRRYCMEKFDVGIIGGGPAGFSTALYELALGKSVVLFEKDYLGGTCLNKGCIPTKAFLHIADKYSEILEMSKLGICCENIKLDFSKVIEYKNNIVSKLRKGLEISLKGVNIVNSEATVVSQDTVHSNNKDYKCSEIIIATGSKPKEIKGLEYDHEFILSSDDVLNMTELPKSILIVGSGAIGVEWSRILSAFGVQVSVTELADRLCPLADWEVSKRIERQFKMKKIKIYTSTCVEKTENKKIFLSNGEILEPDCVLVAVGREPIVQKDNYGSKIIGDASSEVMLAHYAVSQAKELVLDIKFNRNLVPSVIYGTPEIAWVGKVCKDKSDENNYKVSLFPISALGKAHCDNSIDGFIKLLVKDNTIVGASVIAPEASSLIQQIAIAMTNKLTVDDLKKVCFAHPTYSEGIMESLMKI